MAATPTLARPADEHVNWRSSIPFLAFHLVPLAAVFTGVRRSDVVLAVALYAVRMFFITAGYHRYFAHRSYKLGRAAQLVMAVGGTTALQKGPLWWAGHHRNHHSWSDTERDVHSPQKGFWWSHVGWILCDKFNEAPTERIRDFARYPELRLVERFDWVAPWALGITVFLVGGPSALVVGFFGSTVALWHGTFFVNSLAHVLGRRRYATTDTSRNSLLIALVTGGEGWHNNHHHHQSSARQGFFWWEIDPTYYVLRALSLVGIVRDLKAPTPTALAANRLRDGHLDLGMFRAHWARAQATIGSHLPLGRSSAAGDTGAGEPAPSEEPAGTATSPAATLREALTASLQAAEAVAALSRPRRAPSAS